MVTFSKQKVLRNKRTVIINKLIKKKLNKKGNLEMKNAIKKIFSFAAIAAIIFSVTVFSANESNGNGPKGLLTVLADQSLTSGTATADGTGGQYIVSLRGDNRFVFAGMQPGTYLITICSNSSSGPYNYYLAGYQYNGGDVSFGATMKKGLCNPY